MNTHLIWKIFFLSRIKNDGTHGQKLLLYSTRLQSSLLAINTKYNKITKNYKLKPSPNEEKMSHFSQSHTLGLQWRIIKGKKTKNHLKILQNHSEPLNTVLSTSRARAPKIWVLGHSRTPRTCLPKHESTRAFMSQLGYITLAMGISSYRAYPHKQRRA